jgi:ATP/maltotriose-dependent transcriptional regulator MalT
MNQFYVSIIFLGITLIVISLVWIAYDRKKSYDYTDMLDSKKKELVGIISDAEQMVEELNKFSDYVVTQMDIKNAELNTNLKVMEEKIRNINERVLESFDMKAVQGVQAALQSDRVVNGSPVGFGSPLNKTGRARDKVVSINQRHNEVMVLAENGISDTEIARRLNIGKGEVQLILGVNKF